MRLCWSVSCVSCRVWDSGRAFWDPRPAEERWPLGKSQQGARCSKQHSYTPAALCLDCCVARAPVLPALCVNPRAMRRFSAQALKQAARTLIVSENSEMSMRQQSRVTSMLFYTRQACSRTTRAIEATGYTCRCDCIFALQSTFAIKSRRARQTQIADCAAAGLRALCASVEHCGVRVG